MEFEDHLLTKSFIRAKTANYCGKEKKSLKFSDQIYKYIKNLQSINLHHKEQMDLDGFQNDSDVEDIFFQFSESQNYHLLDILSSEKNPFTDEDIFESDDSVKFCQQSTEQSKFQQTQNQLINQELQTIESASLETEKRPNQVQKTKLIQKPPKFTKRQGKKRSTKLQSQSNEKSNSNRSKYNNMGAFLIGSFSYILNNRFSYRFVEDNYEVENQGNWNFISKINVRSEKPYIEEIKRIKNDIDMLPRREGSKQDLFKLINNQIKDTELRKQCKRLIRQELIYSMKKNEWLKQHAYQRDFRPNDDEDGSKKKERHEAYFTYLSAIKQALIKKGELPKRLNL